MAEYEDERVFPEPRTELDFSNYQRALRENEYLQEGSEGSDKGEWEETRDRLS